MTDWLIAAAVAPFALVLVVVCLRDPMRVALPIFAALIPFGSALSIGDSRFGSVSSLVGLLLAAGLVLQLVTTHRSAPRLSPTVPIWLLFLGVAGVTFFWTIDRGTTVSGLAVLASLILVYVFVTMSHVDETVLRRTENGLVLGAVASVLYGLYQLIFLGGFPDDVPGGGIVPDGRFGNDLLGPGVQAISLLLPLAIVLNRAFRDRAGTGPRLLYVTCAGLMVCGVLMTGARAGTLASGLVLLTMALASQGRARRGLLTVLAVGLAAGALVWVYHPLGIASRTFESATSSSGRTDIWKVGVAACSDYCAFGSGWGTYPQVYAETQASVPGARVLSGEQGSYQPHNLWLLAIVELGVPGLVLLVWALGQSLREALRLPAELRAPPLSGLAGLLFGVFFLSSMEFKFFWMVLIMVSMYRNYAQTAGATRAAAVGGVERSASAP